MLAYTNCRTNNMCTVVQRDTSNNDHSNSTSESFQENHSNYTKYENITIFTNFHG